MDDKDTTATESKPAGQGGLRARRLVAVLALVVALLGVVGYWAGHSHLGHDHDGQATSGDKYTCGMHPFIISDKPGNCPICGMALTKIEGGGGKEEKKPAAAAPASPAAKKDELEDLFGPTGSTAPPASTEAENPAAPPAAKKSATDRTILFYRNPMNPEVTSPTPAKDEMGMDYVPVYADEAAGAGQGGQVEGQAAVRVGEEAMRLSGVQTAAATLETVARTVRTVGIVVPDETRVRHVHTKVAGWIDKLITNFTGQTVQLGQPLLSIYSPELLSSQEEFLAARQAVAKMAKADSPEAKALGRDLMQSARRRLELFDVPTSFIDSLEKSGTPQRSVTLEAPVAGFVTAKGIYEGQQVEPGMELFTITDLSHVWIEADLYEYEASAVKVGEEATLTLAFEPGLALKGQVAYVFPYLSPESRTLKVRFDFPNPDLKLKPQMYADVSLSLDAVQGVSIPESAVIDTGLRQVVFVETEPGLFSPRLVKLGVRGDGRAQVLAGVGQGDKVVVKANFLLDSESRLRAAVEKMSKAATKQ